MAMGLRTVLDDMAPLDMRCQYILK